MPRILLTAFEPFDDTGINASWEALRAFRERHGGAWDLAHAVLPVRYGDDRTALREALSAADPAILLLTGQTGRGKVAVERLAINVRTASSDWEIVRAGPVPQQRIVPEGPAAYFSTLPVEATADGVAAAGVPAEISNHAGIYLCNHILYQALHLAAEGETGARAIFLHLPRLPDQRSPAHPDLDHPCLPLDQLVLAIQTALQVASE